MLTTDDLKKLKSVIKEENEDLESKLRGIIREEVDKRAGETELKMEHRFTAVDKRFDNVEQRLGHVEGQLDEERKQREQDRKDLSAFFADAGIFFDEMRNQLVKRIKKLENNQRLSKN